MITPILFKKWICCYKIVLNVPLSLILKVVIKKTLFDMYTDHQN